MFYKAVLVAVAGYESKNCEKLEGGTWSEIDRLSHVGIAIF